MKNRMLGVVSLGVVLALALSALPVAAVTVGPAGDGRTHVTNSDCTIQLIVPVQDVALSQNPDTVTVPMNVQWFDERSANSPRITHYFRENTSYDGGHSADFSNETTGGMIRPVTNRISFDVSAHKNDTMNVTYLVRVYYTQNLTTLCSQTLWGWMHFV